MKFCALVLFLAGIASSGRCSENNIKRCCGDKQFEAVMAGNQVQIQNGNPLAFNLMLPLALDVDGERVGTDGYMQILGGETFTVKTVQLWKEKKQYTIVNGSCTVSPIQSTKPSQCIPSDATFLDYFIQGKNEFVTQTWRVNPSSAGLLSGEAYMSVSNQTCAPVGFGFIGVAQFSTQPTPTSMNVGYGNYTSGIKDPKKYFDVPSSCHNKTMTMMKRSVSPVDDVMEVVSNLIFA